MKITLFYDHVTVIDYAYLDDHLGVVGNSLIANVEFIGKTDNEGILYDFSYAKNKVKEIIDLVADHRLVLPENLVKSTAGKSEFSYLYGATDQEIWYRCPDEALCLLPNKHVSVENLKTYLEEEVLKHMPENVISVKLELCSEKLPKKKARFHYTHGLKQHYGNCQRLFHGHSNTVDVFINGKRSEEFEDHLANTIFKNNIHFCFTENVENLSELKAFFPDGNIIGRSEESSETSVKIKYVSSQGEFEGRLPLNEVYFLPQESTVENLSLHYASYIKGLVDPGDTVQVNAYEGIAKGATSTL